MSSHRLQSGDRLLCYTDGVIEERLPGGEPFGDERLIRCADPVMRNDDAVRASVRRLSHALKDERGGSTSDDATLFLIEWHGETAGPVTETA